MFYFDPMYFLFLAPAVLLGLWAQYRVKATFAKADRVGAAISGAEAARRVLDAAGLYNVGIERVDGFLSDHYDPRHKVLRLSSEVYQGHTMAAVGVAAHEAGHAIQDARHYIPLIVRNAVVPMASFGSGISWFLIMLGFFVSLSSAALGATIIWSGIAAFGCVVFFQLVNLPVEFDASARAKEQLAMLGVVRWPEQEYVSKVLNAAAWTYVAATLQSVLTLLYFVLRFGGVGNDE